MQDIEKFQTDKSFPLNALPNELPNLKLFHFQKTTALIRGYPKYNADFPNTLDRFILIKSLTGGTKRTYLLQSPDKEQFAIKFGETTNHFKDELLADAIYRRLGVPVPDFAVYSKIPETLTEAIRKEGGNPDTGFFRLTKYITQRGI